MQRMITGLAAFALGFTVLASTAGGLVFRGRIDGNLLVPDPASRFQPSDVHGPS